MHTFKENDKVQLIDPSNYAGQTAKVVGYKIDSPDYVLIRMDATGREWFQHHSLLKAAKIEPVEEIRYLLTLVQVDWEGYTKSSIDLSIHRTPEGAKTASDEYAKDHPYMVGRNSRWDIRSFVVMD